MPSAASLPVSIAVAYPEASQAAQTDAALGISGAPGDWTGEAQAVANWINQHGGMAGHPLALNLVPFDPAGATPGADPFASACATVGGASLRPVAVVAPLLDSDTQSACLRSYGLTLLGDAPAPGDNASFTSAGSTLFAPESMSLDRQAAGEVAALRRAGFLSAGARVGIIRVDAPAYARADARTLRPALAHAGVNLVDDTAIAPAQATAFVPEALFQATAAAEAFKLERIDRVIVLDDGTLTPLVMRMANAVGYTPRYGLNSTMDPAALPSQVAGTQLQGAVGVGLAPLLDVSAQREPAANTRRQLCEAIYRQAHVATADRTVAGQYSAIVLCDELMDVQAALAGAPEATPAALAAGMEKLANPPAGVALQTRLGPGRHDGARSLRALAYDARCGCMTYEGPPETQS